MRVNSLPLTFNKDATAARLSKLPAIRRLLFATACAERALSLYTVYDELSGLGKPDAMRVALDQLWSCAETDEIGKTLPFLDLAASLAPGDHTPREQWTPASALAEDSAWSLDAACSVAGSGDSKDAMWAAYFGSYEAMDYLAQLLPEPHAPSVPDKHVREQCERWILNRPFMQQELQRQERDLATLENFPNVPLQLLAKEFRDRAARETHDLYAVAKDVIQQYKRTPNSRVDAPWWASHSPGSPPDIAINTSY